MLQVEDMEMALSNNQKNPKTIIARNSYSFLLFYLSFLIPPTNLKVDWLLNYSLITLLELMRC